MPDTATKHESVPPPTARLESLRGLAAIQVAMFHCLLMMEGSPCNQHFVAPMIVLFNGRAAVTLFFVLSGFVLGLSLRRSQGSFRNIYWHYAIRRIFRIYPTVVVSTFIISTLVLLWKFPPPTQSFFINGWITGQVNFESVIRQLLFINFINPVTWTLRMELVCSMLLPPALLAERYRPALLPWILAVLVFLAFLFPTVVSVVVTPAFFLGFLLPSTYGWWQGVRTRPWLNGLIFTVGIFVLLTPRSFHGQLPATTLIEATGAFLIIGTIVYGAHLSIFKVLDHHFIKAAGRMSYSYYVYHPICLFVVAHEILPTLPEGFLYQYPVPAAFFFWLLSSAFAFPIASLSYARIEKPFINYAKSFYGHGRPASS